MIFQIWTLGCGVLFLILAWRTRAFTRNLQTLRNLGSDLQKVEWPRISVVIPGCNEGETVEEALYSLLTVDYPNLEIVLVNDRSTDHTGAIMDQLSLSDPRIKVVHVNYLPDGWLGKVNALDRGLKMTSGEWVLFSDADVHFSEDALKRAIAYCTRDSVEFLTAIPEVVTRSSILQIVIAQLFHQASLFFKPHRINDPKHRACYGQGAFMLFKKAVYERSERLEWLKMEVVDDTGLALLMRRAGARMGAVAGLGQIKIEWYPTLKAFLKGIEKNAFAFSQYSLWILGSFTLVNIAIFLGFTVSAWMAGAICAAFSTTCLAIYLLAIHNQLNVMMRVKQWTAAVFPISFVILPIIFLRAALTTYFRGGVNWRGTFYPIQGLKAQQRMKLANLVFAPTPSAAATVAPLLTLPTPDLLPAEDTSVGRTRAGH